MTQEQIDDNNELIAQFDGWELIEDEVSRFVKDGYRRYHYELKYHSSWDALMPVVEKIGALKIPKQWIKNDYDESVYWSISYCHSGFSIGDNHLYITDSGINPKSWNNTDKTATERTYLAVINFIKWYNQQKQQP